MAPQIVGAGEASVGVSKADVGAETALGLGKAIGSLGEAAVGVGEAELGTLWSPISGVSEAVDTDISAALQQAVDNHAPLKASVFELLLVVRAHKPCSPFYLCLTT